jgi:hypothetical protein
MIFELSPTEMKGVVLNSIYMTLKWKPLLFIYINETILTEKWTYDTLKKNKQTPWPLVRKWTIPTDRLSLVDEMCQLLWIEGCRMVSSADPLQSLISVF